MRVGVDIGGTFTDAVAIEPDGEVRAAKALTTPGRLHDGVIEALEQLGVRWDSLESVIHGTTAGLNAFLERRGARVALLTTKGFRDVYELGRANRPEMYNVRYRPPTPLVPRRSVFEVDERLAADGSELVPVDGEAVRALARQLSGDYQAVAICLLHSYANPDHEREVARLVREVAPDLSVVCSHDVAPEWREYERTSSTVITAYIAPIVERYLADLERRLADRRLTGQLRVMQSNGGIMTAAVARGKPIQTLFSGPVGGTVASASIAEDLRGELDVDRLICVDMGGTSFDMSLVIGGRAEIELETMLQGHPLLSPAVAIHTIGAGGGSIGHVEGGGLRVGPQSAGADPGPACYGAGGIEPTITDANLHLGRLPRTSLLAGGMALDTEAAESALASVGDQLGLNTTEMAAGMIAVADAAMANAIREITVLRGIDPREFALVAFGGAGPLHALAIAHDLDISKVVVPTDPGVLSAYGMLQSETRHDVVQSYFRRVADVSPADLDGAFERLFEEAKEELRQDEVPDEAIYLEPSADLRYSGQEYTVTLMLDFSKGTGVLLDRLPQEFALAHEARYGHSNPGEAVELVNLRTAAYGRVERPPRRPIPNNDRSPSRTGSDRAWFRGEWLETDIYDRHTLGQGDVIDGPAIVTEAACTSLISPGWQARVSVHGHLVLARSA